MAASERPARPEHKEVSEYEQREVAKERALTSCVDKHRALFECYKRGCWGFTRCCGEEHDAFWQCYTAKRGVNKTKVGAEAETWAQRLGIVNSPEREKLMQARDEARERRRRAREPGD